ncbi:hypothetical protein LCGC14_1592770 [marine sediment metagenome]|uniref:Uncharacterized protein n=1 Tax=marine sediment metagenome TaxID=412755 RepID=A0A0F9IZU9_9ZZZZ
MNSDPNIVKFKGNPHKPAVMPPEFSVGKGVRVAGHVFEIIKIKRNKMTLILTDLKAIVAGSEKEKDKCAKD